MDMKKYKGSKKLTWTDEAIEAFHYCRIAVSNCQELYFLEDTETPILQTDESDCSSSLPVPTLFDTGASRTTFVNRHVVAWIESKQWH